MQAADNRILKKMLDRLFASLINGPSLNCRPHSSRQRVDLVQLGKLKDATPEAILKALLGPEREAKLSAKVPAPRVRGSGVKSGGRFGAPADEEDSTLSPEERAARSAFSDQQSVFGKLRAIAEDARTYENDTGVHVLQIGFPLLSLPPGAAGKFGLTRRILAPLAFVSLAITVKAGPTPSIAMECRNDGADLVVPNVALLAWLERQTGQAVGDLLEDEAGDKPWAEIVSIARRVCELVQVPLPPIFSGEEFPADLKLMSPPKSDDEDATQAAVLTSAVVGLFPMANQSLLRDMQALVDGEPATGPIESFIKVGVSLEAAAPAVENESPVEKRTRAFSDERLVTVADPCQARAVRLSRTSRGLVVHGPPGTGKSQTIANIIGDHLARGQRVLFVCDKRTALDVVLNRLDGMGLGSLCGIVHDPQRDQRELYRSIREQLETLSELKSDASADGKLTKIDAELQSLHGELTAYHAALMTRPDKDALSFHELMGRWLSESGGSVVLDAALTGALTPETLDPLARGISDLLDRAVKVGYPTNAWAALAAPTLDAFLTTPVSQSRDQLDRFVAAAATLDATTDPGMPPLPADGELDAIAASRARIADDLERLRAATPAEVRSRWASADSRQIATARDRLVGAAGDVQRVTATTIDRDLFATVQASPPTLAALAEQSSILETYLGTTKKLLGFLAFGHKSAAGGVLAKYGLQLKPDAAVRAAAFVSALRARLMLRDALSRIDPAISAAAVPDDDAMLASARENGNVVTLLHSLQTETTLADVRDAVTRSLATADAPTDLLRGLRATKPRVEAIHALDAAANTPLLLKKAATQNAAIAGAGDRAFVKLARQGKPLSPLAQSLVEQFDTIEGVLRVREALADLPDAIGPAVEKLVAGKIAGEPGVAALRNASDATEITQRLSANRVLVATDAQKLQSSFARYRDLDAAKRELVRAAVLHRWATRQKDRLLAATGGRMNSLGADLRRRLMMRGERAMRLRQVISVGRAVEGGDPLFDLRPVWMASPETVAQIFARQPIFDVVIFDEASQCRLEEALPVLLRANRVVIAGDPKQLPPTRFFESAIAVSEDEEIETDQQLFENQQGEIEDLLAAALNIEIDESYLDVHYRSHNSDLIEFSNEKFYGSRLQAIPGHPHNRTQFAPLTLYKVSGVYEKRANEVEAEKVCTIVRDLLKRAEPPSIGIACFNVTQRDLIVEKLDELAVSDAAFGKALAAARERRSKQSFEGLFVKNLENVQGDERDHMIISTTYGPDAQGRFYRRFGPVGSVGGGRRLNVLVTRARDEVHLVTSIPETAYRNRPPIPLGETPGGAWLLFAYLVYAEQLAEMYAQNHRLMEQVQATHEAVIHVKPNRFPSAFAEAFGRRLLAKNNVGSDVCWGNEGFCVDVALHHPTRAEDVTVGVLTDLNRFEQSADPIEWEVFRMAILESQGWTLSRVWTPAFFRDPDAVTRGVLADAAKLAAAPS